MKDLIEQLEAAKGPDRRLDADIALTQGWSEHRGDNWIGPRGQISVPAYTSSIDAALSLVPKGSAWAVSHGDHDPSGYPRPHRATVMPPAGKDDTSWHDYPALALCIAALKARAASPRDENSAQSRTDTGG